MKRKHTPTQHHAEWISSIYSNHEGPLYTPAPPNTTNTTTHHHHSTVCPPPLTKKTNNSRKLQRSNFIVFLTHEENGQNNLIPPRGNDFLNRKCLLMIIRISGQAVNSERSLLTERKRPSGTTEALNTRKRFSLVR
ncbi:hypothetical protein GBF38_003574 [Nibea albiflora]|uniref:Uncharacterized protein n=1 Tax=Nibea albiflora TaxID=240163 RepID=A0ACB7FL80_NIBAL|nr:hypothetical protein GBF38_003574 [Nibea albiflora]